MKRRVSGLQAPPSDWFEKLRREVLSLNLRFLECLGSLFSKAVGLSFEACLGSRRMVGLHDVFDGPPLK